MRYNRGLLLITAISAIFLATDYSIFFASSAQARSQTTTVHCTGGSCYTVSCLNDQPCQAFSSNQPSLVQPAREVTAIMQPAEETPIMQSVDEAAVMQPVDDATEQYTEVPVEFCDDGIDNDDDGKVDEDCGSATSSLELSNDLIDGEDHMQQSSIEGLEQQNEEYENSDDESNARSNEQEEE